MTTINRLSSIDSLQDSDQIPVFDESNGDARKASMSTLSDYISSAISSLNEDIFVYDTVSDLKASTVLQYGYIAETKGYHSSGDRGGARYLIVNAVDYASSDFAEQSTPDGYADFYLNDGKIAYLLAGDVVHVEQAGAVGDGVTDDTAAISAALTKAFSGEPGNKGSYKIQFGILKDYKISSTLNIQGKLGFIDDPDGSPNYGGCNVDVDFGNSTIHPTVSANPALIMWGQNAVFSNLTIDFSTFCTRQETWDNKLVGVRLCPSDADQLHPGYPATYNSTYDRIIITQSYRGFEMPAERNFLYRCKFQFCEAASADYGFYIDCDSAVGDGTSNAFQQCHVRAGDFKNGVSYDGSNFICIQSHVSGVGKEPPASGGADSNDYWYRVDWENRDPYPAWETSAFYGGPGKGYYLRAGAIFAFTGHNSVDGCIPHKNNVGPALYVDSPQSVSITGGLHLERHYLVKDYVPLIDIHGADFFCDAVYMAEVDLNAPNASTVFGSAPSPIVLHGGTNYQVKANHLSSAITEPGVGADWATYWDVFAGTPDYAGDWAEGNVYRVALNARNVQLNNIDRVNATANNNNQVQVCMDRMDNVNLGLGYFKTFITGDPAGQAFIIRNTSAIRQYVNQQPNSGFNTVFTPSSTESGTHYRFDCAKDYYQEMDLSGTASSDIVDGAYFEMQTVNSADGGSGPYTATAGQARVTGTGSNVYGPTVAKNGQTLCINKHSGIFYTWIKSTSGYNPTAINAVYSPKFDEYTVATLPTPSLWAGHMIMVTDETGGYTPAFCDGTNWRRVADRVIVS
jgi:hypothetical protein